MGQTPRYQFQYLDPGEPLYLFRGKSQVTAENAEAALTRIAGYVNQLATVIPGGQTFIGIDTDGRAYFDPAGSVSDPAGIGVDTDGRPYFTEWNPAS